VAPHRSGGGERPISDADAIAVRDLSKRYATHDGVGEGDFVAVVGPVLDNVLLPIDVGRRRGARLPGRGMSAEPGSRRADRRAR